MGKSDGPRGKSGRFKGRKWTVLGRVRNQNKNLVMRSCTILCLTKLAVMHDPARQTFCTKKSISFFYIIRSSTFRIVQLLTLDLTINYQTKIRFSGPSIFIFSAHSSSKNCSVSSWLVEFDGNYRPVRLKTILFKDRLFHLFVRFRPDSLFVSTVPILTRRLVRLKCASIEKNDSSPRKPPRYRTLTGF